MTSKFPLGMFMPNDLERYTERLTHSMEDKLWFLPKLPDVSIWVDFGCADGALLDEIYRRQPTTMLLGYDHNNNMVRRAEEREAFRTPWPNCATRYVEDVEKRLKIQREWNSPEHTIDSNRACLILSSVLHEMASPDDALALAQRRRIEYIAVRDMMFDPVMSMFYWDEPSMFGIASKLSVEQWQMLRECAPRNTRGCLTLQEKMEFLLKYRYVDNWRNERLERYFSVHYAQLCIIASHYGYYPVFFEHAQLPWVADHLADKFDFEPSPPTHMKVLFKLRKKDQWHTKPATPLSPQDPAQSAALETT